MIDYYVLLTTAGQNKLAAAAAGGPAVSLTAVRIGDGGGAAYDPNEAQAALVGERYTAAILSIATQAGGVIVIEATIPQNTPDGAGRPSGGFNIREAGIYCADGSLFAIAKMPGGYKPLPSSGASEDMTIRLVLDVGNAGNIVVTLDPSAPIGIGRLARIPWIAVDKVTNAPPGSPAIGATVLVGTAPTGAFAGHAGKIAQWLGAWQLGVAPDDTIVSVADRANSDPSRYLKRAAGGWVNATASEAVYGLAMLGSLAEHVAGVVTDRAASVANTAKVAQGGNWNNAVAGGTANALTSGLSPVPVSNPDMAGMPIRLKIATTNTGAATLALNGLAPLPIRRLDGQPVERGDLPAGAIVSLVATGTAYVFLGIAYSQVRIKLTSGLTIWVRPDGDDNNDGSANTAAAAMKTILGAYARAIRQYDTAGFSITIRLGVGGDYQGASLSGFTGDVVVLGDLAAPGSYNIRGQPTTDTPIVTRTNQLTLAGVSIAPQFLLGGASNGVYARSGSVVNLRNVTFKPPYAVSAHSHVGIDSGASVFTFGEILIVIAGGDSFINVAEGGSFEGGFAGEPTTIKLFDGPGFATAFCRVVGGAAKFGATTITGGAYGKRYSVALNGTINTYGGGANFLPGDAAGVTASGGQYA